MNNSEKVCLLGGYAAATVIALAFLVWLSSPKNEGTEPAQRAPQVASSTQKVSDVSPVERPPGNSANPGHFERPKEIKKKVNDGGLFPPPSGQPPAPKFPRKAPPPYYANPPANPARQPGAKGSFPRGTPLLQPSGKGKIILQTKDQLTAADPFYKNGRRYRVHVCMMMSGRSYQIDLTSDWDNYLYLESPDGMILKQDDDSGGLRNARIRFFPSESGSYRIIATTFLPGQTGTYTLTVQEQ